MKQQGFTLIEVLMALTVFSLIVSLTYTALEGAGSGFQLLSEVRQVEKRSSWTGRQLRSDLTYIAPPEMVRPTTQMQPALRIINDNRGEIELDELWLQVREPGVHGISQVHYYIDEERGHLLRESRLLLAKDGVKALVWDMGEASSWAVDVLDQHGNWRQDWGIQQGANVWPKAVRVRLQRTDSTIKREWLIPLHYGVDL